MPKKPKLPRVGPRNPCAYPVPFPKARLTVNVAVGSCRGAKNGKPGKLFIEKSDSYTPFNTSSIRGKGTRSSSKDAYLAHHKRKQEIKQRAKSSTLWGVRVSIPN